MENQHLVNKQPTKSEIICSKNWQDPKMICKAFEKSTERISIADANYFIVRQQTINESPLLLELNNKLDQIISDILHTVFGQNYANISTMLVTSIKVRISAQYSKLRLIDFQTAFLRKNILKKEGVGMTIAEFFAPIEEWITLCNKVNYRIDLENDKELEAQRQSEISLVAYQKEQKEMLELFEKLKNEKRTIWTGTPMQAFAISKIVSKGILSEKDKKEIYFKTVNFEMEKQLKLNPLTKKDIYTQMLEDYNHSSYEIRFKCAEIVVNECLMYHSIK